MATLSWSSVSHGGRRAALVVLVVAASGDTACRSSDVAEEQSLATAIAAQFQTRRAGWVEAPIPAEEVFHVQLRPPVFRWIGRTRLVMEGGVLQAGARENKAFTLPILEGMAIALVGDSTVRYALSSPSGRTILPGVTPDGAEYHLLANEAGVRILAVKHPEAGDWSVTADASASKGTARYSIDVRADDPIVEGAHLEVMPRDGDPRVGHRVYPGEPVFIRAFVATDDHPLPGVDWKVKARTPKGAMIHIPVKDDGRHADGAAGDGIFVGAIIAEDGPDGVYMLSAEGRTPSGTRYVAESRVEVEAKNVTCSPDPAQ